MKKNCYMVPFNELSDILNNIQYEYACIFSNGVAYNIRGHMKFKHYLLKHIFSKEFIKKYYSEVSLKNAKKAFFYNDRKPIRNSIQHMKSY